MATLTNTQISVTYVGLLKTSANTVLSSTAQQITDGSGNNSILYLSTAEVGIGASPTAGKELDVTGNVLITGDLQVDNININGNTISATSGVVTLSDGTIATTQSQNDNSTKVATTAYVDTAIDGVDTLAEVLAIGNTTGGTDIAVSANDDITFTDSSKAIFGTGSDLQIYHDASNSYIDNTTGSLLIRNTNDDYHVIIQSDNGGGGVADYFRAKGDTGEAILYHYGTEKFKTTSSGATVTGDVTVTGQGFITGGSAGETALQVTGQYSGSGTVHILEFQRAGGAVKGDLSYLDASTDMELGTSTSHSFSLKTGDTRALTIDSSQNVLINSGVYLSWGTNGASSIEGSTVSNKLQFRTNSTDAMIIDSSQRVGIGTTSPSYKLEVVKSGADGINVDVGSDFGGIRLTSSTGAWSIRTSTGDDLFFYDVDNANQAVTFERGGHVGIGTSSPAQLLNLSGDTNSYTTAPLIRFDSTSTANVNIRNWAIGPADSNYGNFHIFKSATRGGDPVGTTQASTFTIDYNGNVGIGTTSPGGNLHVVGASGGAGQIYLSDADDGSGTGDALLITKSGTSAYVYNRDSGDLGLGTSDSNTMLNIQNTTGNVGIGTTSPSDALEIYGAQKGIKITNTEENPAGILFVDSADSGQQASIKYDCGDNGLKFFNSTTERMVITSSGNVGINDTSPDTAALEVVNIASDEYTGSFDYEDTDGTVGALKVRLSGGSTSPSLVDFIYGTSLVGAIVTSGSATTYLTSSDYRLKENVVELTGALDRLDNLQPKRFNFTSTPDQTVDGFLAHEVSEHVPEAIEGTKDETYQHKVSDAQDAVEWTDKPTLDNTKAEIQDWLDENNIEWQSADTKQELLDRIPEYQQEAQDAVYETRPKYQGIDQSKLVPLLVAAVKELKARIEVLENS